MLKRVLSRTLVDATRSGVQRGVGSATQILAGRRRQLAGRSDLALQAILVTPWLVAIILLCNSSH